MEQMITIAIPTYNRPKQLLETLKNLQRQTNQNFRIFICDNASDYDVNTEVKNNFTGEFYNKITIHRRNINVGADANIVGLFDFVGKGWMWIVSDDDVEFDTAVDTIYKRIDEYPDFAIILFSFFSYLSKNIELHSINDYINELYPNVKKDNAVEICGDFCSSLNKVYNLNILKSKITDAFAYVTSCMTTGIVFLKALQYNKGVYICHDKIIEFGPAYWDVMQVSNRASVLAYLNVGLNDSQMEKLLYIINIPYRMPLHYWLQPEHHNDIYDRNIQSLYYGYYRYHLPFKEKLDYYLRMKLFSNSIIYFLHLKINSIAKRVKSRKKR